jgi:hypothetical protein
MKQNISMEQLNELSDRAKENLRKKWEPEVGDQVYYDENIYIYTHFMPDTKELCMRELVSMGFDGEEMNRYAVKEELLPLLSIGQMIEILANICGMQIIHPEIDADYWINGCSGSHLDYTYNLFGYSHEQTLCEALWGAVVKVLEDTIDEKTKSVMNLPEYNLFEM